MKNVVVSTLVVLFGAAAVLGSSRTYSYWLGTRQAIRDGVDDNVPLQLEEARARALAKEQADRTAGYEDKVLDLAARADAADRKAADLADRLDRERQVLAQAKAVLDRPAASYAIGGRQYARADVARDATRRLQACRDVQDQLRVTRSMQQDLLRAVSQGKATLAEARRKQDQLQVRLDQLAGRRTNAEARQELAALVGSLSEASVGSGGGGELEHAVQNIDRRVSQMERRAAVAVDADPAAIDYAATGAGEPTATGRHRPVPRRRPAGDAAGGERGQRSLTGGG